jgi:hypothetical protein
MLLIVNNLIFGLFHAKPIDNYGEPNVMQIQEWQSCSKTMKLHFGGYIL